MWFTRVSLKNPVFATMVMLAIVVLGLFSYQRLQVDQFPNVDFPVVVITTEYPGASPEIIESEVPTRVLRFELIPDSGGTGAFRGGLGIRREYVNLQDARFSIRSTKHVIAPEGAAGGGKGRTGDIVVNAGRETEKRLPTRYADYPLKAQDIFCLDTPGGGGLGNAKARDPARVASDANEGYVTEEAARRDYGVALVRNGRKFDVDLAATAKLREGAK